MGDKFGGLAFLPLPNREPDRDGFLSEVLTGWKRSHSAQNFTLQTTRRRVHEKLGTHTTAESATAPFIPVPPRRGRAFPEQKPACCVP